MAYLCNVDIGGTHTDAVVIDQRGSVTEAKVSSTPDNFSRGFFNALEQGAAKRNLALDELLERTEVVSHGTTVGTNAIIEGEGVDAALVTTRGAEDVMFVMRGGAAVSKGQSIEDVLSFRDASKPDPIVERKRVYGVDERVDCMGDVVVDLNEERVRNVARELARNEVDAVAVNLLWSFLNDSHEVRIEEILEEELPDGTFLTRASDLIPKWGEYERTTATAINAYIGPSTSEYIDRINDGLGERGYDGTLLVMQSGGGVMSAEDAVREPVKTIDSGPAAGIIGCRYLSERLEHENIIAADMGGTSFDIGLLTDGEPITQPNNVINQYEYMIRNVDVDSIGSGGGSIAQVDADTGRLQVGPESAGADPGPACYGRGGTDPTVTDADLLLGFLDPDHFLGGRQHLDESKARDAMSAIGDELGMSPEEVASGVFEIVTAKMADSIRQRTINRGHDPRKFVLYAYGGAGPLHVPAIAPQLDVDTVVVPSGDTSSVWSALGVSSSDFLYRQEVSNITTAPFDPAAVTDSFRAIEDDLTERLRAEGFEPDEIDVERYADLRYQAQVHQVSVPVPNGRLDESDMDTVVNRFERKYEDLYGEGAGYTESGFEMVTIRCDVSGRTTKPNLERESSEGEAIPKTETDVLWPSEGRRLATEVYEGTELGPGMTVDGPAIVRMNHTTVAIPPEDDCEIDQYDNYVIDIGGE
ncbi:hydantoinase/oxoprolinase family protein [Natrinema sp. H-ect4]|uniref:hydantoinase/oxoprolinase family protein n=1 Tax=Natrinema sp. H-ect4 TaxID=3242699 RepID=UPI0035A8FC19